uniref:Uncharacterized protein n=1 Tax=Heterorhabditis bacteriophora TaxID=37862 RepID=A0A1I7WAC4_HETBA
MGQKGPFTGQRSRKYSANHFELRLGSSSARGVFTGLSAFGLPFIPVDAELSSRTVLLRYNQISLGFHKVLFFRAINKMFCWFFKAFYFIIKM